MICFACLRGRFEATVYSQTGSSVRPKIPLMNLFFQSLIRW